MEPVGVEPTSAESYSGALASSFFLVFPRRPRAITVAGHRPVFPGCQPYPEQGVACWCWLRDERQVHLGRMGSDELGCEVAVRISWFASPRPGAVGRDPLRAFRPYSDVETSTAPCRAADYS